MGLKLIITWLFHNIVLLCGGGLEIGGLARGLGGGLWGGGPFEGALGGGFGKKGGALGGLVRGLFQGLRFCLFQRGLKVHLPGQAIPRPQTRVD